MSVGGIGLNVCVCVLCVNVWGCGGVGVWEMTRVGLRRN